MNPDDGRLIGNDIVNVFNIMKSDISFHINKCTENEANW
jgi:hypothetical protein